MTWTLKTAEGRLPPIWDPIIDTLRKDQQKQVESQNREIILREIPYRPDSTEWIHPQKNTRLAIFFIGSLENSSHSAHYAFLLTPEGEFINLHPQASPSNPLQGFTVDPGGKTEVQHAHLRIHEKLMTDAQKFIVHLSSSTLSL